MTNYSFKIAEEVVSVNPLLCFVFLLSNFFFITYNVVMIFLVCHRRIGRKQIDTSLKVSPLILLVDVCFLLTAQILWLTINLY